MAALTDPLWFHGRISREEGEARLRGGAAAFPPGLCVFLVRRSATSPTDFVLMTVVSGGVDVKNLRVIASPQAGGTALYQLDTSGGRGAAAAAVAREPRFASLAALIEHYKGASTLPLPLGAFVAPPNTPAAPIPVCAADPQAPVTVTGLAAGKGGGVHRDPAHRVQADAPEIILAEGYLYKIRGIGQTRARFFRLTTRTFSFYAKEAGDLIDSIGIDDISAVSDIGKTEMRLISKTTFGQGHQTEMVLEAPTARVKERWTAAFRQDATLAAGGRGYEGKLLAEGYLVKVQTDFGHESKKRWFVLSDATFGYYKEEGHELMGSVPLASITVVTLQGDTEFKVIANERFTKSGNFEVVLRCESHAIRNRWIAQFQLGLPRDKFQR